MNKMIDIDIKSAVCFTVKEIEYICKNLKKRAPGSDGEKEAAEYMAQILETKCGVDNPLIESFSEHPSAFYGYFRISSFFDVMTFAGYFIHPILSIVSAFIALFLFIFQFMMYKEIIDPFFPLKKGTNVTGIRKCSGEIKNRVFINGHIDAAWEFPLNNLFGGVIFEIPGAMALIGVITLMIFSFSSLLGALWVDKIIPYTAVFVPFFILVAFTYNPRIIVDVQMTI